MNRTELYRDIATIFFIIPFISPTLYAIYLWSAYGFSSFLPSSVYLQVTRDPYIFLIGIFSVILASVIEIASYNQGEREQCLWSISSNIQKVALSSFVLAFVISWYSNNFTDISGTVLDFFEGRFNIIFPSFLVLYSFLLVVPIRKQWITNKYFISSFLLILIPPVIYLGRREPLLSFILAFLLLILAILVIYLRRGENQDKVN
jgi:hypothetical protein